MSWDAGPRKERYPEAESQRKHEDILRAMEETKSGLITSLEHLKLTLKPIGVGFWGEVYKVVGESNEPQMVLKLNKATNCESRHNMLKEVNIMRSLDHPNIVRFHGVCVHNNQLHPLLEFVNGGTLEELLQNQNVELPWDTRLSIARDIACGMEYLHENKIMHRDLTSNNILLKIEDDKVTALLADFGLATDIAPNAHAQTVRSVVGTVDWMAPEVILGEPYNFKADVFSYGIILCELIGRCEADPDVLPRTRKFEVDFDEFAQLACEGCPPEFLKLAKECCSLLPQLRPEFPQILQTQEELIRSIQIGQISNRNSMITENTNIDGTMLENLDISVDSTTTVVDANNLTIDEDTAELILKNLALELSKEVLDDSLPMPASPTTSHSSHRFSTQFSDQDLLNLTMKEPRYEGKPKNSGGAINIFQDNQRYKHLEQQNSVSRRSSIITLTPSVNRDSGRICLTFINDNSSSFDMTSPVPDADSNNNGLLSAREILEMQRRDEDKAIGDIQEGHLVLFKPELTFSTRHASVDEMERDNNNTLTKGETIPYAKRNFSQKKKIKPSFPKMFGKSDKKKSVSADGATTPKSKESQGILGFFRSFSTKATGSSEKDSQSKSKIQKRKQSDDKQAGVVTKMSPHMSPKHVKHKIRIDDPKTPVNNTASDPFNKFFNKTPEPNHNSVKNKSNPDLCHVKPQHDGTLTRTKRTLSSPHHSPDKDDCVTESPRNQVVRNESYRQMKAYRAQSIPSSDGDQETKKPGRSKSFREKFFLSDKAKNTRI